MTTYAFTSARVLLKMLTYRRPVGSKSERRFIREYIMPLGVSQDKAGNIYKRIGDMPVMWSCHTDTVHRVGGIQKVTYGDGLVTLAPDSASNCLGADDTTGIWLMREMILAERPGLYVFHRGEEIGGVGSSYVASRKPAWMEGIQWAIAFDRMGYSDVITHQGSRCCSDAFAEALAKKLGMGYAPSDGGFFTDTANYVGLIGECTNLSVGYHKQHTVSESQDVAFALQLRDVLLSLDASDLPVVRKPGEEDPADHWYGYGYHDRDPRDAYTQWRMADIVADHPGEVADILQEYGIGAEDLLAELYARGAVVERRAISAAYGLSHTSKPDLNSRSAAR